MKNYELTVLSSNEEPYYFLSQDRPHLQSSLDCIQTEIFDIYIKDFVTEDVIDESVPTGQPDCRVIGTYVDGRTISTFTDYLDGCDAHSSDILDAATNFLEYVGVPENFFLLESITHNEKAGDSLITRILQELPLMCYHAFYRLPEYILYYPESFAQSAQHLYDTGIAIDAS